jgi:hypothetical protein
MLRESRAPELPASVIDPKALETRVSCPLQPLTPQPFLSKAGTFARTYLRVPPVNFFKAEPTAARRLEPNTVFIPEVLASPVDHPIFSSAAASSMRASTRPRSCTVETSQHSSVSQMVLLCQLDAAMAWLARPGEKCISQSGGKAAGGTEDVKGIASTRWRRAARRRESLKSTDARSAPSHRCCSTQRSSASTLSSSLHAGEHPSTREHGLARHCGADPRADVQETGKCCWITWMRSAGRLRALPGCQTSCPGSLRRRHSRTRGRRAAATQSVTCSPRHTHVAFIPGCVISQQAVGRGRPSASAPQPTQSPVGRGRMGPISSA